MGKANIIALVSQKGGSGKTTLTMQLVAGLALRGFRVCVGDLDAQESASRWIESADAKAVMELARLAGDAAQIRRALAPLERVNDFVVLDCPPSIEHSHTVAALDVCDLALIPVVPSPTDLWSTRAIERLIVNRMGERPALRGALVPNRVTRTVLAGDVLDVMREFSLPVLGAALSQRNAYAESAVRGGSVYDLGKAAAAAQGEVDRLVTAVLNQLGR
ncbi:MAG: ParA family protein [Aromatoleum sp.]|jgi:chromosome partitioning protein|uniref:ParA family protein n=1 Tax=Aromatoleum sp. TaxID=2307007 RepID=UPI002893BCA4|nr:ParA family protein [Aromatoleum sp.]MDT3672603.1 ParA family protein [Aromatoleum sp.]